MTKCVVTTYNGAARKGRRCHNGRRLRQSNAARVDREAVNRVKTAFGLDNPAEWVASLLGHDVKARVYDIKQANSFLLSIGYKASRAENVRSGDIIALEKNGVKTKLQKEAASPPSPSNEERKLGVPTATETSIAESDEESKGKKQVPASNFFTISYYFPKNVPVLA